MISNYIYYFIIAIISNNLFYLCLVLTVFLIVLIGVRKNHENWNKGWLSELIDEKVRQSKTGKKRIENKANYSIKSLLDLIRLYSVECYDFFKNTLKRKIISDIKDFHLPSFSTLSIILIIFLSLFFASHRDVPYGSLFDVTKWIPFLRGESQTSDTSNLISIITGITSVVFALVIFVAESIRDSKNPDQKRVLLRISNLWPLVLFTILSLLNFLIFKVTIFGIIFPIIIAFLSIYSFWKIIIHLVNPVAQEEDNSAFLRKRIQDNVNESIRERLGNNIILEKVGYDKDIKFEYTFSKSWLTGNIEDYIFIDSDSEGRIVDVNLEELQKLTNYLKSEAEKLGFKIYPTETTIATSTGATTKKESKKDDYKKIYLLKRFGEYIPPTSIFTDDSKVIFAIPKEFSVNESIPKFVRGVIPHIFRFSKDRPSSETFRKEMKGIKDRVINAIKSTSLGSVEELKQSYLDLAEIFLETIHDYGGGYSAEQAKKERGNFFEGWNEIRWLRQDIRELIQIASDSDNQDIISDIIFLPTAIAIRAFHAKDHFLFQEFLSFNSYVYYLASNKPEGQIRSFMLERCWRHLKEISDLYIESKIKDRDNSVTKQDMLEYKDFALYIFKLFQTLIKASFDKKDYKSFEIFVNEFAGIFKRIDRDIEYPNSEHLKLSLQHITDPDQKKKVEIQIEKQIIKEDVVERLSLAKKQVFFALASKVLDFYKKQPSNESLKQFFDLINSQLTLSIEELTKVFDSCRNFTSEDYWGWDDWETIADGEVHVIDVHSKFDYFYCVKILGLLRGMTDEQIAQLDMPYSRDLAFLAENRNDNNTLVSKLNQIKQNPQDWLFIIDQQAIDKIDKCIELLQVIKQKQEDKEKEYLKTVEIDPEKLQEFKTKIKDGFTESTKVRPLVKVYNAYKDKFEENPGTTIPSYGYNQVDEKAAFVKDWYVHYGGWGDQYGSGMANSEDQIFFETIVNNLTQKIDIRSDSLISSINENIDKYGFTDPVVIQSLDYMLEYDSIKGSEYFIDKWKNDCPKTKISHLGGFLGVLKYGSRVVPVFDIFVREKTLNNKVVVTDLSELGVWEQYLPVDKPEDVAFVDGIFYIRVSDLNIDNEVRQKILSENSAWLQEYSDKEGYLRQKVNVRVYQKFRFLIKDVQKGFLLSVSTTVGNSTTQ
jgi:hypothetical protein